MGVFQGFLPEESTYQTLRGRNKNAQLFGGLSMILQPRYVA